MDENISKQEKVLGIDFLNAPTGNSSYGMRAEYAKDSTSDSPVIKLPFHKLHTMLRVRKPYTYIIAGECFMAVFENDIKNILDKWQLSW